MKRIGTISAVILAAACLLSGCSHGPDAGVLLREAKADAQGMQSCTASIRQTLVFTADGAQHTLSSSNQIQYTAKPFALKSVQTAQNDGTSGGSETYTVTEDGRISFYFQPNGVWQKTDAGNLDTDPAAQVDILRLLDDAQDQSYVRQMTLDGQDVHKIELRLSSEALRSSVESIVTAAGMADDSSTVVQALLDGAQPLYGYCYVSVDTGRIVRIEADLTQEADRIFQNIDGSDVKVHVTKCEISGDISAIDNTPAAELPKEAKDAASVQAYG